eukprot:Sspe_Gene.41967::Locus_20337_Transcript_1_1_Confidence_1.000_Length_507::g.41967::m.41967
MSAARVYHKEKRTPPPSSSSSPTSPVPPPLASFPWLLPAVKVFGTSPPPHPASLSCPSPVFLGGDKEFAVVVLVCVCVRFHVVVVGRRSGAPPIWKTSGAPVPPPPLHPIHFPSQEPFSLSLSLPLHSEIQNACTPPPPPP